MMEYWEQKFQEMETLWGFEPAESAIKASIFFKDKKLKKILIPGIGYGRNANVFIEQGMQVTGIEISKSAIIFAKERNGLKIIIHHGSVNQMPFDNEKYDGIYCYALIHLLNKTERKKLIENCYKQLKSNGYMIFTAVSKKSSMYGNGKYISKNRYLIDNGLNVYFYDLEAATHEFENFGLQEVQEIEEPIKFMKNQVPINMIMITCFKK